MDDPIRVLHVEDDPAFARLVAEMLDREAGFDVVSESDAPAGLDRLASDPGIDCVVSDYEMPGMDGLAFLGAVREEYPGLPFVLFTGKGSEAVAGEAIAAGATDYLQKAGGVEQYDLLANRIRNAVEGYRSRRRAAERERVERVVREIDRALVRAETRREIEGSVCRILADADPYTAACVAGVDPETMRVEPRTVAGDDGGYVADLEMYVDADSPGRHAPGGRAYHDREVAVSQDLADDDRYAPWREAATDSGIRSLAVVPLDHDGDLHGLLAVFAGRPDAFDRTERELLAELGDDVAHALDALSARSELRETRAEYAGVFDNARSGLLLVDVEYGDGGTDAGGDRADADGTGSEPGPPSFRYRRCNPTVEDLTGLDADDVRGHTPREAFGPEDGAELAATYRECVETGEAVEYTVTLDLPVGEVVRECAVAPIAGTDREALAGGPADADGSLVRADAPVGHGDGADAPVGRGDGADGTGDGGDGGTAGRAGDAEGGDDGDTGGGDGGAGGGDDGGAGGGDGGDRVEQLVVSFVDVTDRERHRRELEETTSRLEALFEESPDMIDVHDAEGTILDTNPRFRERLGYGEGEVVGRKVWEIDREIDPESARELWSSMEPGDRRELSGRYECRDGSVVPVEVHVRRLDVEGGDRFVVMSRDVTDRRERADDLGFRTALLEAVGDTVLDGLLVVEDREVLYYNDRYAEMWDVPESVLETRSEDRLIEHVADKVADPRPEEWRADLEAAYGDPDAERDDEVRLTDGRWIDRYSAPVTDGDADYGRLWVFRDVTERKRAQRELERRKERIETLVENVPIVLFAVDDEGRFTVSTGRGLDRLGLEPGEAVGESAFEMYADHPEIVANLRRALDGQRRHARTEIGDAVFETWYRPVVEDGEVRRVIGAAVDVTERADFERTLATLHDVATDLADADSPGAVGDRTVAAAEAVLEFDLSVFNVVEDGLLRPVATSAELSRDDVTEMSVDEGIAGKTYRTGESMLVDDLRTVEAAAPQGEYRSAVSVPVGDHGVLQAVAREPAAFDDRDRELAELLAAHAADTLDRLDRERRLRRRNERLDEFASVVSHDLQTPIEVATGRLELARADPDGDRLPDHLAEAAGAVDRMDAIVEDLLTLARHGVVAEEDLRAVELSAVAGDAWDNVATGGATLCVETDRAVRADRGQFGQLLENLFRNSVEHGSTGPRPSTGDSVEHGSTGPRSEPGGNGDRVTVTVGEVADGEGFFVADDGPGIPPEERGDVFEAGYSTAEDGTGFGLRIVRQVAEAHGWTVSVTDAEGGAGGARFEFRGVDRPDRGGHDRSSERPRND